MKTTPLSRAQRQTIEEFAAGDERACYFCRSTPWQAPYYARPSTVGFTFILTCASCGDGNRTIKLSKDDAATRLDLRPGPYRPLNDTSG
jgi:hypothetical protein